MIYFIPRFDSRAIDVLMWDILEGYRLCIFVWVPSSPLSGPARQLHFSHTLQSHQGGVRHEGFADGYRGLTTGCVILSGCVWTPENGCKWVFGTGTIWENDDSPVFFLQPKIWDKPKCNNCSLGWWCHLFPIPCNGSPGLLEIWLGP